MWDYINRILNAYETKELERPRFDHVKQLTSCHETSLKKSKIIKAFTSLFDHFVFAINYNYYL